MIKKIWKNAVDFLSKKESNSILIFFLINVFFVTVKTFIEYFINFNLEISTKLQTFIALVNPIPTAIILIGIALFFKGYKSYWIAVFFNFTQSLWLFANILYYREFSNFLSFSIMGSSSSVGDNLGKSIIGIIHPSDFLVFLDILVLIFLLIFKQINKVNRKIPMKKAGLTIVLGFTLMVVNYGIASFDRSGLLTRTFDTNYLVKYLGLNEYLLVDANNTYQQSKTRKEAKSSELVPVKKWINDNRVPDNVEYFGSQKGKNVFVFHLESFQQFLIDFKVNGKEVTPNINKFFHDQNTISFDNFYNQVGQGKTSDAETMLDNSLFGLPSGSAMSKYGTKNTFESVPGKLKNMGYTTAVLHGGAPSFWNRLNAYKRWGYDYFFSSDFFPNSKKQNLNLGYGMLDKVFLRDSTKYIEQLPQPFYAKVIAVSQHYPYLTNSEMKYQFPKTTTNDSTVDSYVQAAHYVDEAFQEFINWLKETGLYDSSIIYAYGDHYGISENHTSAIAQLMNKDSVSGYDLNQWQKVPFMIHSNNLKGGINHTFGGEIDVAPTLYDLLGINDENLTMVGHDLLSPQNNQIVAFRNADWVTPTLMKKADQYFDTNTGELISQDMLTDEQKKFIKKTTAYVKSQLSISDSVIVGDLLRFDNLGNLNIKSTEFNYTVKATEENLKQLQIQKPSSLLTQNNGKSSKNKYQTDEINILPKNEQKQEIDELKKQSEKDQQDPAVYTYGSE
ncbi:MAG: LTA synthase family protein [Lactobacillaceae bacterium]|jgi:lipoteichoic acid synthase|nr:LTA synthase family protein [Lactobacillaceae bacterium]